jgi:hypothetical protein
MSQFDSFWPYFIIIQCTDKHLIVWTLCYYEWSRQIFGKLSFIALQISNSIQTKIIKQDKPTYQIVTVKQQFLFLFQYFIINKSITDTLFLIIIIIILIIIIIIKSCRKLTKKPFLRSMKQAKQVKIRSNYSAILHVNKCLYCNWWRLNILSKIRTETFPHTAYEHKKLKLKQCLLCDRWRL